MAQDYAATINPGLEKALIAELRELGAKKVKAFEGGATFRATKKTAYRCVRHLRCANQVRLRIDEFRARDIHELFKKVKRIEWSRVLKYRSAVNFRVATHTSRLNDSRVIIGTVSEALETLGYSIDATGNEILLRLENDRCVVSLDASGREMHKHGYRTQSGDAPIRESTASALIRLSGYDTRFIDPCCGSGTFVIEAALRSLGKSPRPSRRYPLELWEDFDADLFGTQTPSTAFSGEFTGYDIDPAIIKIARENSVRAGVQDHVSFSVRDIAKLETGHDVLANPPYNERISDKKLSVIAHLEKHPTSTFVVPGAWKGSGKVLARFQNGGLPVKFARSGKFSST